MTAQHTVVIFSDPGVDDALAIAVAALSKKIDIAAVVGVAGNVASKQAARNLASLFQLLDLKAPVFQSDDQAYPLLPFNGSIVHGVGGLGDVELPKLQCRILGVDQLPYYVSKLNSCTILSLGPATSLAQLIQKSPQTARVVNEIVMMGGAIRKGNITAHAEFNIFFDPEAADVVFQSGIPIRLIPLDITEQVRLFPSDLGELTASEHPIGELLVSMLTYYFNFHEKFEGFRGCYVHDPLTVVALLWPELFSFRRLPVVVDTRGGPTRGMTMVDLRYRSKSDRGQVYVACDIDAKAAKLKLLAGISHFG